MRRLLNLLPKSAHGWHKKLRQYFTISNVELPEAIADADPTVEYSRYLDVAGHAPPEDVGGLLGFEMYLSPIADAEREQHRELKLWNG